MSKETLDVEAIESDSTMDSVVRYTPEEDELLVKFYEEDRTTNTKRAKFRKVSQRMRERGYTRSGKSIHHRYNYIKRMESKKDVVKEIESVPIFDLITAVNKLSKEDLSFLIKYITYKDKMDNGYNPTV